MKITKLEDKIFYYENLIDSVPNFINDISIPDSMERVCQISKWSEWKSSDDKITYGESKSGSFFNMGFSNQEDMSLSIRSSQIKFISDIVFAHYIKETSHPILKMPDHFDIRKYYVGADMGIHADSNDISDPYHPVVSGVLYLNDDYEGGELEFAQQGVKIKPSAGSLVMFPSYQPYYHRPFPVTDGTKYMIPLFWYPEQTEWVGKIKK
jgi:hypothetical protein